MGEVAGIVLIALFLLGLPLAAIVMALQAKGAIRTLERKTGELALEIASLRSGAVTPPEAEARTAEPEIVEEFPTEPEDAGDSAEPEAEESEPGAQSVPPLRKPRSFEDIEKAIGAKWSVVLGGIAVALGAIFLVRYTIEAGILGPKARIAAGGLFSMALFGAGEWLRRHDRQFNLPAFARADIPGVLTGAGAIAAFATAYSAYALYEFIGPAAAFVLLTLIGLASLALSAVHGPKLAALGVVGAYGAPLLVTTDDPNPVALAIHTLVVTASVLGTARIRDWLWLAFCGVAGAAGWTALAANLEPVSAGLAGAAMLIGMALMFGVAFGWEKSPRPNPPADVAWDGPALAAFGALFLAYLFQYAADTHLPLVATGLAVPLVLIASACYWPAFAPAAIIASAMTLVAMAALQIHPAIDAGTVNNDALRYNLVPPDVPAYLRDALILGAPIAAAALYGAWRYGGLAKRAAGFLASGAAVAAVLGLVVAYLRVAPFETRPGFGAAGLALALGAAGLAEWFARLDPQDNTAPAPAAFAVASVGALSFAIGVSLDSGWFPLSFALAALGVAYVHTLRPVAILPWLAVVAGIAAALSLWASLPFDPGIVGRTPLLNRLVILTGVPALAMIAGGEIMRRNRRELPGAIVTAFGLAALGLFTGLEIRHWLNGGEIVQTSLDLGEAGTQTLAALGFTAGLQRAGQMTGAPVYRNASLVAGAISALWIAVGLLLFENPLFDGGSVGLRPFFNLLLPGYLLTGIAAGLVALYARPVRPRWFTLGFATLSGLLLFAFVSLTVRHAFQGESLAIWHSTGETEFWTYSAAWLVTGAAVLALGLWLKSMPVRLASALLIGLTICKVFLLDMAELEGALRAFSFIGLGLSLLAIGRFYQRILIRSAAAPT